MAPQGKDLRTFLAILDERFPGEVLRVDTQGKEFDIAECDAAAFLAKLKAGGKRPLTLFRGFKTLSGKTWQGELLFSELSTLRKQAAAMDLDGEVKFQELAQEFSRRNRLTQKPIKISSGEAPVKQNVLSGAGLSLFDLPVYRKDEFDAKPGWLCAIGVGKEPDSGRYNLSWHRLHVHAPGYASARINPRHLMEYMNRYRAKGADKMPVAFALGHHPAFEVAAGSNCAGTAPAPRIPAASGESMGFCMISIVVRCRDRSSKVAVAGQLRIEFPADTNVLLRCVKLTCKIPR
jgi:UbiD family decarboxylase